MVADAAQKRKDPTMKLSDTQLVILTAAAQRANLLALPLPQNLKGGAAQKVVSSLLKQGLLEEVD
ncbi:MAG: hypothetical protein INH13_16105, partial [Cupriavidus sp.]|nr:hypothetical protein [Cupriavidus sp.]